MARQFIVRVKYGGLGDHLFFSHLPRIAKTSGGYERVYVSTLSEFRCPSYLTLVWQMNPYVDGLTVQDAPYPEFDAVPAGMNLLDRVMLERGLEDGVRFHEPEVYYKPRMLPLLAGKSVYDPNFVSGVGIVDQKRLDEYFRKHGPPDFQLKPRGPCYPVGATGGELVTESLFHYCDIIHSCERFFCLTSGGATLAAALGKPAVAFFGRLQNRMFLHSRLHRYVDLSASAVRMLDASHGSHRPPSTGLSAELSAFGTELRKCLDFDSVKIAIDLGSRDGQVAVALRRFFPKASIFAFECNPDRISDCRTNLGGRMGIELVEKAVSDVTGDVDFYAVDRAWTTTPHPDGNIGASSLFQADPNYPIKKYVQRRIIVPATTLADWAAGRGIDSIDVVWMDLQGAELKALRGLGALLSTVKAVYTEVAYRPTYVGQPLAQELDSFLWESGFALRKVLYRDEWLGYVLYTRGRHSRAEGARACEVRTTPSAVDRAVHEGTGIRSGGQVPRGIGLAGRARASHLSRSHRVSVCVVTDSGSGTCQLRRRYLSQLLASLDYAGLPTHREVIVAGAVAQSVGTARVLELPDLAATGQVCRLRNAAIAAAQGDILILCDDDVLFSDGYWQAIQATAEGNWDILCTRLLNPNGTRYWDWAAHYPSKGQTLLPYDAHDPYVFATGDHAVYRRHVFEKIHWNEQLRHGDNEEFDLAAQARAAGLRFAFCEKAAVWLQYPHCDAAAAVTGTPPKPPEPACPEFLRILAMAGFPAGSVAGPSGANGRLLTRLRHKVATPARSADMKASPDLGKCRGGDNAAGPSLGPAPSRQGVFLLTPYYLDDSEARQCELDTCIRSNLGNEHIERVYLFLDDTLQDVYFGDSKLSTEVLGRRPTFGDLLRFANRHLVGSTCVIANTDIIFDGTLRHLAEFDLRGRCLVLSRHDILRNGELAFSGDEAFPYSQDAWVLVPPLSGLAVEFPFGIPGCDLRFAYELAQAGILLENPSKKIVIRHLHLTEKRNYDRSRDLVPGRYLLVPAQREA